MQAVKQSDPTILQAEQTLAFIEDLKKCKGWTGYMAPRLEKMRDDLARRVVDEEKLTPDEREKLRQRYLQMKEVCALMAQDEAGQRRVLGQ